MNTESKITRPVSSEFAPFFANYIGLVPSGDLVGILENQIAEMNHWFNGMSDSQSLSVQAPYQWTFRQVVGHLTDGERVFGYRLARILVGDSTELPGFDENLFVDQGDFNSVDVQNLVDEWTNTRKANLGLIKRSKSDRFAHATMVSGNRLTARSVAYILVGHVIHHLNIVQKRLGR